MNLICQWCNELAVLLTMWWDCFMYVTDTVNLAIHWIKWYAGLCWWYSGLCQWYYDICQWQGYVSDTVNSQWSSELYEWYTVVNYDSDAVNVNDALNYASGTVNCVSGIVNYTYYMLNYFSDIVKSKVVFCMCVYMSYKQTKTVFTLPIIQVLIYFYLETDFCMTAYICILQSFNLSR